MQFVSTRGRTALTPIDAALVAGLAPDGGLYVPGSIPTVDFSAPDPRLSVTALRTLAPYFVDSALSGRLARICADAFSFEAPLRALSGTGDHALELFHGPTAAFKDYAARFLARALEGLRDPAADRLEGAAWLAFLDGGGRSPRFDGARGQLLLEGVYRPDVDAVAVADLRPVARQRFVEWMEGRR